MYPGPSPGGAYWCMLRRDTIVSDISEFCSMSTHRIARECSVAREEASRRGYWTSVAEYGGKYDRLIMRINEASVNNRITEASVNNHPSST